MAYQTTFSRYEIKFLLDEAKYERILSEIGPRMEQDAWGKTTVRNLYYDTPSYRLCRRSLEKPVYKEKLRLRSYGRVTGTETVFAELKKKYKHRVYKRRLPLPEEKAVPWLGGETPAPVSSQIAEEIDAVLAFYREMRPTVFLSYDREAFYSRESRDFRLTFDRNVLYRCEDLSLQKEAWGTPLLPEGRVLMELKCAGGIPLWMAELLSRERIYKTSFSKYGTAFCQFILPQKQKSGGFFYE
ncbi:MAG: polyphosphate polymerase domain-containing protein [Clostridia bacterium]|nr:polyphosphate polymerase domain-containing protein [Clostridia bacterium]